LSQPAAASGCSCGIRCSAQPSSCCTSSNSTTSSSGLLGSAKPWYTK
jgi:hypothetical protein